MTVRIADDFPDIRRRLEEIEKAKGGAQMPAPKPGMLADGGSFVVEGGADPMSVAFYVTPGESIAVQEPSRCESRYQNILNYRTGFEIVEAPLGRESDIGGILTFHPGGRTTIWRGPGTDEEEFVC